MIPECHVRRGRFTSTDEIPRLGSINLSFFPFLGWRQGDTPHKWPVCHSAAEGQTASRAHHLPVRLMSLDCDRTRDLLCAFSAGRQQKHQLLISQLKRLVA